MNEKWYSLSVDEVEKKLNTDVSSGLSSREASSRIRKNGENSIYSGWEAPISARVGKIAADITVIILSVVLVLSAFFLDTETSVTSIFIIVVILLTSILSYLASCRIFHARVEKSAPDVHVIRGGKVYLCNVRHIAVGDVILLRRGDVVPCDVRLVHSDKLKTFEFTGIISGKEIKQITKKDADAIIPKSENPPVDKQFNMVVAGSVVLSGTARAVAVRIGKDTFSLEMLGPIDLVPRDKQELRLLDLVEKWNSRSSLVMLIATIPITVAALIMGNGSGALLNVLSVALSLAAVTGSELLFGVVNIVAAHAVRKCVEDKNPSEIKFRRAICEMNYTDTVIICGNSALQDKQLNIERFFAANRFYDADLKTLEEDSPQRAFLETALLGTAYYLTAISNGSAEQTAQARVISDYYERVAGASSELLKKNQIAEFLGEDNSLCDTSLIKNGDQYSVVCSSFSTSLLNLCSHIRTPDGILPFDLTKKDEVLRACTGLHHRGQKTALFASRVSPCSSLSRLGAVQNQLIFEGYIIYSDPYVAECSEKISELRDAEINVFYFGRESTEAVLAVYNTGIVSKRSEIAYASSFERAKWSIDHNFGQYRAYLGFSSSELQALEKKIKGENGTIAVITSSTSELGLAGAADISVAVSDSFYNVGADRPLESFSSQSQILKKNADVLIPRASKKSGGILSLISAIVASKNACTNLCKLFGYLIFSNSVRIVVAVFSVVFGIGTMSCTQILFSGFFMDFAAVIYFAFLNSCRDCGGKLYDAETLLRNPLQGFRKYAAAGVMFSVVIILLLIVFGSANISYGKTLSFFSFISIIIGQLFAIFVIGRPDAEEKHSRAFIICLTAIVLTLTVLCAAVPLVSAMFGVAPPDWQICASAPIVAVIGYVILFVTERYI